MLRDPVDSSNLAAVGYDPATCILEVEFRDGSIYQYLDVPTAIFHGLMTTTSKGKYFRAAIRMVYAYKRLRPSVMAAGRAAA